MVFDFRSDYGICGISSRIKRSDTNQTTAETNAVMILRPTSTPPQRILMDATFTLASGKKSGIERVVGNLLRESKAICGTADADGLGALPTPQLIVSHDGEFFEVDEEYFAECERLGRTHANILSSTSRLYRSVAQLICSVGRWPKLRQWLLPSTGHLGIFKASHAWNTARARRRLVQRQPPLSARPGDLIVLPDAYWVSRLRHSVWPAAEKARQQGAFVATVVYDLIPLTHPEFVGERRRESFRDYLTKAAKHSDQLLAISKTVRDQVRQFLPNLVGSSDTFCSDIRAFPLGAELRVSTGKVREEVLSAFAGETPPYLMVSTFDPRKNHAFLLDAFEQLCDQGSDVHLCFVGRIGAQCEGVVSRIREHALLGSRLFLFDDLSDAELQHCYRQARAVVFPSVVEGFGLPIVEALWFGKKTFASDTPIHREVGEEDCVYFDLNSPTALVHEIVNWEAERKHEIAAPQQRNRTPTTWRRSALELLAHCLQGMAAKHLSSTANETQSRAA